MTTCAKDCIVTCGVGKWYPRGVGRMASSYYATDPSKRADILFACASAHDEQSLPDYLPPHSKQPYAFKPCLLMHTLRNDPQINRLLWLDASCWFVRSPAHLFGAFNCGYFISDGWTVGQWCSDAARDILDLTYEEACKIPLLWAAAVGFDTRNESSMRVLEEWHRYATKTDAFKGSWSNQNGEVSSNPNVLGHRHDQTILSVLVHRAGLPTVPAGTALVKPVAGRADDTVVCAQGM